MRIKALILASVFAVAALTNMAFSDDNSNELKAREIIDKAVESMGGETYLAIDKVQSSGRYFWFTKGRKSFLRYQDWSVMAPLVKSRVQLGKGKQEYLEIVNLQVEKGWRRESEKFLEFFTEEDISDFKRSVRHDLDYLLRERMSEEGMSFFYYGKDEISGSGQYEAVEFVDAMSDTITVYFNLTDSRPARTEYYSLDKNGVRQKKEQEFYNWHEIQGVNIPLRIDSFTDGELSSQRFIEEITFNGVFLESLFLRPAGEEWVPGSKRVKD
jgi:hypothetical protein